MMRLSYYFFLLNFQVCVEGNIGSGKTTFLDYFKKFSNIIEVKRKLAHRPILSRTQISREKKTEQQCIVCSFYIC